MIFAEDNIIIPIFYLGEKCNFFVSFLDTSDKHQGIHKSMLSDSKRVYMLLMINDIFNSGGSDGKASACNAGDLGSILGLGRSPAEGNGNPLQHSCLENPMDGGA